MKNQKITFTQNPKEAKLTCTYDPKGKITPMQDPKTAKLTTYKQRMMKQMERYSKRARPNHASGYLRDSLCEALDLVYCDKDWWTHFGSKEKALKHIRRLWHCTDIIPNTYSDILVDREVEFGNGGVTYATAVRALRNDLI